MALRDENLTRLRSEQFDVAVIGGGINGAVSAAALAARGVRVALIDRADFAGATSQHSSNLAWGGIKYMESWEFGLVRQLCGSRNRLLTSYPSTVREIRFLTTLRQGFRYRPWLLWAGAWLYWLIGNGRTRPPRLLSTAAIKRQESVVDVSASSGGIEYSDAYLFDNDARFVFNFIRSALDSGAAAANYVEATNVVNGDHGWRVEACDCIGGQAFSIAAKVLINAGGPYVDVLNQRFGLRSEYRHVFSKGIHLIVDRITRSPSVLAFFADDGRLFFAIPMGSKTCIGTTDTRIATPDAEITPEDRAFVLDNINNCLALEPPLAAADIIAERCGVRPLAIKGDAASDRDFLQLSRKHAVDVDRERSHISIFGGKLTDCINVGEEICQQVAGLGIAMTEPLDAWYGEGPAGARDRFMTEARSMRLDSYTPPTSAEPLSERLWRRYGEQASTLLAKIHADPRAADLIIEGSEFIRCEIELVAQREMVVTLEDLLRRRSKLAQLRRREELQRAAGLQEVCGILFGAEAQTQYDAYFAVAQNTAAATTMHEAAAAASSVPM